MTVRRVALRPGPAFMTDAGALRRAGAIANTTTVVEIGAVAAGAGVRNGARSVGLAGSDATVVIVVAGGQAGPVAADQVVGAGDRAGAVAPALAIAGAGRLQHRLASAGCRLAGGAARIEFALTAAARAIGAAGGRPLIGAGSTEPTTAIVATDLGPTVGGADTAPTLACLIRSALAT